MAYLNEKGIVQRKTSTGKTPRQKATERDWYLAKKDVYIGNVKIPKKYWGEHVRFNIEVLERKESLKKRYMKKERKSRTQFGQKMVGEISLTQTPRPAFEFPKTQQLCKDCGTKLVLRADDVTMDDYKRFKEEFCFDITRPKGYRCPRCGACYDDDYKKQDFIIKLG